MQLGFFMIAQVTSGTVLGIQGELVTVELETSPGLPEFSALGANDPIIKESRHRIASALRALDIDIPSKRIIVNLAPATLPKRGTNFDLPIAIALLISTGQIDQESIADVVMVGELSLDGGLRGIRGVIPIGMRSILQGVKTLIIPAENGAEASTLPNIEVFAASHLIEVIEHLRGGQSLHRIKPVAWTRSEKNLKSFPNIIGQPVAKRAIEIAAAGNHHILFSGPPGSGKTMLAEIFPSLLPPLTDVEALEVMAIHSMIGSSKIPQRVRPFRAPHHHTTPVGLTGGGTVPTPGEVTLAHRGVLFLDELPEFSRASLEALREPLSSGAVTVSRAGGREIFPAKFVLIAAMNPCPCGYYGIDDYSCRCSLPEIIRYQQKLSGPILDRIPIRVVMAPAKEYEFCNSTESCMEVDSTLKRIAQARAMQIKRFEKPNSELTHHELVAIIYNDKNIQNLLAKLSKEYVLTYRAMDLALQVALTIANIEGRGELKEDDLLESVSYQRSVLQRDLSRRLIRRPQGSGHLQRDNVKERTEDGNSTFGG
ncbi:MAG: hypothetical protein A3F16_00190 [Deltaproteobacteria bacterium RIFCSPHIGHO2_12_FULL_43_9]|nr:MAG: hypothetical protein A3F16_00190 [Deltaproteobacteria bacterium RIFCSPHIGHO2_12_FULL_43_9]